MKIIIAGGRDYEFTEDDIEHLDELIDLFDEVVCGCARGVDTEGKLWAIKRGIPVKEFPADWNLYGKSAGALRNKDMAEYADGVILFKGGRGTENMFKRAKQLKLHIWDWREDQDNWLG